MVKTISIKIIPHPEDAVTKNPNSIKLLGKEIYAKDGWKLALGERAFVCFVWFPKEIYPDDPDRDKNYRKWCESYYYSSEDYTVFVLVCNNDLSRIYRVIYDGVEVVDGITRNEMEIPFNVNIPVHFAIGKSKFGRVLKLRIRTWNHALESISARGKNGRTYFIASLNDIKNIAMKDNEYYNRFGTFIVIAKEKTDFKEDFSKRIGIREFFATLLKRLDPAKPLLNYIGGGAIDNIKMKKLDDRRDGD